MDDRLNKDELSEICRMLGASVPTSDEVKDFVADVVDEIQQWINGLANDRGLAVLLRRHLERKTGDDLWAIVFELRAECEDVPPVRPLDPDDAELIEMSGQDLGVAMSDRWARSCLISMVSRLVECFATDLGNPNFDPSGLDEHDEFPWMPEDDDF